MKNWIKNNLKLFAIASITLGLAPFSPPHIVGKLEWLLGGGAISGPSPMQFMDWFDLVMHGAPWLLLLISLVLNVVYRKK